jgi:hypothetical protein
MVNTPLQENLGGEAGTVVLTGGADDAVEEDSVNRGNSTTMEEGVPKSTP